MFFASTKRLTHAGAKRMADAAIGMARDAGIAISVAIADAGGHLILLERMDGGRFHSVHSATTKAVCSASNRRPTSSHGAQGQTLDLAHPLQLRSLHPPQAWALVFCCFNTLIAYGAYAEAIHLGEVARVSATVTVSPLFTSLASVLSAAWLVPEAAPEIPNLLTMIGIGGVVCGSALCALAAADRP